MHENRFEISVTYESGQGEESKEGSECLGVREDGREEGSQVALSEQCFDDLWSEWGRDFNRVGESWRELERVGESWRELESLRNPYSNRGIGDVRVDGVLGQLLQHLLSVDANLLREITNSMDKAPRQAHTGKDCSQTTDCPSRQTAVGVAL